jgi:hypothetical protein
MASVTKAAQSASTQIIGTGSDVNWGLGSLAAADGVASVAEQFDAPFDTYYLRGSGFGFAIPPGARINGIVLLYRQSLACDDTATRVRHTAGLGKNLAVLAGTLKANFTNSAPLPLAAPVTYTDSSVGTSTDLWGLAWSAADVNSANFAAAIAFTFPSISMAHGIARVDQLRVTVNYTPRSFFFMTGGI